MSYDPSGNNQFGLTEQQWTWNCCQYQILSYYKVCFFFLQFMVSDITICSDETVSCTIIFKQCTDDSPDTKLSSQTFYNLRIPTNLVGNRSSAKSIMIGTLFVFLQWVLEYGGFSVASTLTCIINQDEEIASTIHVATTHGL